MPGSIVTLLLVFYFLGAMRYLYCSFKPGKDIHSNIIFRESQPLPSLPTFKQGNTYYFIGKIFIWLIRWCLKCFGVPLNNE